jgi:hypothetical protein
MANLKRLKVQLHLILFGLMQIWVTVLVEGFSSDSLVCFCFPRPALLQISKREEQAIQK